GDVFLDNNLDKIRKFFNMLNSIVEERKALFSGGNYFQYIKDRNVKLPLIVVVIDNYIGFNEKTEGLYEEELINISRIGVSFGINLVITASGFGVSEVTTRISDNIRTVVALEMSDNYKYMDVLRTSAISVYPEKNTKGRGLCFIDGRLLEFQTALSFNEDDYVRNDKIREIANVMQTVWSGDTARNVPYIPDEPNIIDFCKSKVYEDCIDKKWLVPVAYRDYDATAYCINLKDTYCYLISGKRRTGKTNTLQVIMKSLVYANRGKVVVVEQSGSALRSVTKECNAQYIEDIDGIVDLFSKITQTFKERNILKNNCIDQGMSYSQIFDKMSCFESIFILIDNLNEFFREIYSPTKGSQNYGEFIENIIEKGYLHNIYFFGCMNSDDYYDLYEYRAYKLFTEYKRGVHLGGYLSEQKIFDFDNLSYLESSKSMKRGTGMASSEELNVAEKIIVPFAGGANIK
ncbi:MAG: hypothetical protein MSH11_06135, partial [Ruminococcus sp.]|nr:hypothetical protein [Ruminococcus sp.]